MKKVIILMLFFLSQIYSQSSLDSLKNFYIGFDIGRGVNPLSTQSYPGSFYYYPVTLNSYLKLWNENGVSEPTISPTFGLHLGYKILESPFILSFELKAELLKIKYTNYTSTNMQTYQTAEYNSTLNGINIIPRVTGSFPVLKNVNLYFGIGLVYQNINYKDNYTLYGTYPDELIQDKLVSSPDFVETIEQQSQENKFGFNLSLGTSLYFGHNLSFFIEYDYYYLPQYIFHFEKGVSEKNEINRNNVTYVFTSTYLKRDQYFNLNSSDLKIGINYFL